MMGQGGKGKIQFKEQKKDKGWVNRRRDDEVLRKEKYVQWQKKGGQRERGDCVIGCMVSH